jgi:hypothetical protein
VHIESDPKLLRQALDQQQLALDQRQPLVIRNVWISHLTPDRIWPYVSGQEENEQLM